MHLRILRCSREAPWIPVSAWRTRGCLTARGRSTRAVRTIRSGDSKFDRYAATNLRALSDLEKTGLTLFRGKARCSMCHAGPNFTDENFHNTGIAWRDGKLADKGAGEGRFKVPTLREVARTAPYMHDGGLATLEEVIEYYDGGGNANPWLDAELRPRSTFWLVKRLVF